MGKNGENRDDVVYRDEEVEVERERWRYGTWLKWKCLRNFKKYKYRNINYQGRTKIGNFFLQEWRPKLQQISLLN